MIERKRGEYLEMRRLVVLGGQAVDTWLDLFDELRHPLFGYPAAVDRDLLPKAVQSRRSEQADVQPGGSEHALGHLGGASLSVRPGDLHAVETVVRVTETCEHTRRRIGPQLGPTAL